jgi:hypothetical protein
MQWFLFRHEMVSEKALADRSDYSNGTTMGQRGYLVGRCQCVAHEFLPAFASKLWWFDCRSTPVKCQPFTDNEKLKITE